MAGLFGTDGVRARINTGPMTAEAVVRLALAAGRWFADHNDRSSHDARLLSLARIRVFQAICWNRHWLQALPQSDLIAVCYARSQRQRWRI